MTNPNFEIRIYFPFDDQWEERDAKLYELIGLSDWGGAGNNLRDHGYIRASLDEATRLRDIILLHMPECQIAIQEAITH